MNPSSVDIAEFLEGEIENLRRGDNLFVSYQPDEPSNCVIIFDTSARPLHITMDRKYYEYPSVQVQIRYINFIDAWAIAEEIKEKLLSWGGQTVNDVFYSLIHPSAPFHLGRDEKHRELIVINCEIQRRKGG